ncbi:MAG TPA: response regulator [Polyangia bacterium]|nr:response regulator [Polyangia bacterium]
MPAGHLLVIDDSPTVLKVIELALAQAGYAVSTAADDEAGLALVREARTVPDLILLDGLIPNRDPAEICRRFASDPALQRVPVVVMVARGQADDLESRFAKASNVVDFIGKPFSPDALQAVVSHVVAKRTSSTESGRVALADADSRASAGVRAAVDEALSRSADAAVAEARAFAARGQALAGDLEAIFMSEILALLAEQGQSGILRVVNTEMNARVELYFRGGRVDFASAVGVADEFLLGRFIVDDGDLAPETLDQVLAAREKSTAAVPLFGADLIARGLITREALTRAMVRQTSELAYEALRWRAGFFQFRRTEELSLLARDAALQINVDRMLLEGYWCVDEWRIIERDISNFDEVFVRNDNKIADTPRGTFTRDELAVLEQIDGRQSVRDVVRKLRLGSFDVGKMFFRLHRARLIRRRVPPTASR